MADSLPFNGFQEDNLDLIRLPEGFFSQLLPDLNDLNQLRLLLYMFWHMEQQEGKIRYFRFEDLASDPALVEMCGGVEKLKIALDDLVAMNIVLKAELDWMDETLYFINGRQGRAAIQSIEAGTWREDSVWKHHKPIHLTRPQPNIFKLYEENIGPITPMMAEVLKADEADYPSNWIEEAIRIAVTRNARNWKYVQAILERWQTEGRDNEQNRRDNSQDPGSYRESWLGHD